MDNFVAAFKLRDQTEVAKKLVKGLSEEIAKKRIGLDTNPSELAKKDLAEREKRREGVEYVLKMEREEASAALAAVRGDFPAL